MYSESEPLVVKQLLDYTIKTFFPEVHVVYSFMLL
jgi:hypothetical protein